MAGLSYGSVCSGIEAATVAWHPLGWRPSFFSEIEAAPRAVLQHRHPEVPLHGDFTTIREGEYGAVDLLVGGTPCQPFSVAGLRGGLADDRGNLALEYLRLAQRLRPRWLVWENVPGVLSSNGGRDFGAILGGMVELGYGFAYRVLDAQYVRVRGFWRAVPQRRRRVFVVGHLGDWRRAAAVLLERACLRGDPAPCRETGAGIAVGALAGTGPGGGWRIGPDEATGGQLVAEPYTLAIRGRGDEFKLETRRDGTANAVLTPNGGRGGMGVGAIAFDTTQITSAANRSAPQPGDPCHPLAAGAHAPAIAFSCKDHGADATDEGATPTLRAMGADRSHANAGGQLAIATAFTVSALNGGWAPQNVDPSRELANTLDTSRFPGVQQGWAVRRLTPRECERLQGFSDDYTLVPWRGGLLPDGPRYKALGNSMAVNVMRWIGQRIAMVDGLDTPTPGGLAEGER